MYSLLMLFSALALWTYLRALETGRVVDWGVWAITITLALYSHLFAGLLLLGMDLDGFFRCRRQAASLKPLVFSNTAIAVLLLPKPMYLAGILWMEPPTILHIFLTIYSFIFGNTLVPPTSVVALFIAVLLVVVLVMAIWWSRESRPERVDRLRLLLFTSFVPLLATFVISQWFPIYLDRWLLEVTPSLTILIAWGMIESNNRQALRICGLLALVGMLVADVSDFVDAQNDKPPYRQAVEYIAAQRATGEVVFQTSASTLLAGNYYDQPASQILVYDASDQWLSPFLMQEIGLVPERELRRAIEGRESFWLAVAPDHIPEAQRAENAMIDSLAAQNEQIEMGGTGIYHYAAR